MTDHNPLIQWAPRVKMNVIKRLYELDGLGIRDEELIDKVGWALLARCQSFITAVEAVRGQVRCPLCSQTIHHNAGKDEVLKCPSCSWEMAWSEYFKTIQHKQLSGAEPVLVFFREYKRKFPIAREPEKKMLLIDQLIHCFHINLVKGKVEPTRCAAVNLIEGSLNSVVDFLNRLSYGSESTPGLMETWKNWQKDQNKVAHVWDDDRLRQK